MVDYQTKDGSRFIVDLGDVRLPAIVEKQVETDIRAVVLRALADLNPGGNSRWDRSIFDMFPGRTLGLWLDPDVVFEKRGGPLTPEDHTIIIREIMKHPFHVLRYLDVQPGGAKPSDFDVLEATLQVEQIDDYTKERIRTVLDILPKLEEARANAPKSLQRAVDTLERQLVGQPIEVQIRLLRSPELRAKLNLEGLVEGMEFAARVLEDGASSIYSPDFSFNRMLSEGQPVALRKDDAVTIVAEADTIGGAAGGAVGLLAAGVGAGPGAAAGAAGASAGAAIAAVVDWLFF